GLELLDSGGTVLATGGAGGGAGTVAIPNFVGPPAGTHYVRLAGAGVGGYRPVVLPGAGFGFENNHTPSRLQSLPVGTVLGAIGNGVLSPDQDVYAIGVSPGGTLHIRTVTPADGPGEFGNTLNPRIELFDATGVLVATGVPLADGRNEEIAFT